MDGTTGGRGVGDTGAGGDTSGTRRHTRRATNYVQGGWPEVADNPQPFLSLDLCTPAWLDRALPVLLESASFSQLAGTSLLHLDVRSDNLFFRDTTAVLVDWNLSAVGNPECDVAFWLPSLHMEGGPSPEQVRQIPAGIVAIVAGFFASRAGRPVAQGRREQATDHFTRALYVARATDNRNGEQYALTCLSHIHRVHGRYEQAEACCRQVLDLANKFGDRNWQFEAHQGIGRTRFTAGDHDAALAHHHTALDIATELGHAADQVRAHDGAANAHLALGSAGRAQQHWKTALDTLVSLGTDHTEESGVTASSIRTRLANLTPEGQSLPGEAVISTGGP